MVIFRRKQEELGFRVPSVILQWGWTSSDLRQANRIGVRVDTAAILQDHANQEADDNNSGA
jgi:hypothetical protein